MKVSFIKKNHNFVIFKKLSRLKNGFGFTLIELLLAMGILAFLATSSVAILGNFNRKQNIKIAKDDLKNGLAQAKSYALSQVVSENCDTDNEDKNLREELVGYEVRFDTTTDPQTYSIFEICESPPSGSGNFKAIYPINTYDLPNDISFVGTPADLRFNIITGRSGSTQIISITSGDGTLVNKVEITSTGVIRDK